MKIIPSNNKNINLFKCKNKTNLSNLFILNSKNNKEDNNMMKKKID